jgi:alpha-L-rhamnosidase
VRLDRSFKAVAMTQPEPGVYLFDGGQNLTGNAEIELTGPAGTEVTLRYGEKLDAKGRLDQSEIGTHVLRYGPDQAFQTDRYTLKGQGREHWYSRFGYNGFRYVEVTGAPGPLTKDDLTIRYYHSAAPEVGEFTCSNPLLNRIWQNGRWSYFSNLFGMPTDCPHREKNGWTGDAQIACEQGLFYADGITIYQKWINDLADEQFITGALPGIVPTNGQWGYGFGSGPAWDSAFLLIPWHLYQYYGDATALKRNYDGYRRYVEYLTSRASEGIVNIGLGDWCPWKTKTPADITDTGYYYRDARIVATVARMLGKQKDAENYDALAETIRHAFTSHFYYESTGKYGNGSQTSLACALYQDLVEPGAETRVLDNLVATIAANDDHVDFGFLGAKYVLNTLTAHGRADTAYAMVAQKTQPGWGWQVEQGATTLWENWTTAQSNNHTFFGDVNAWMMKTLAGINPDPAVPGFKHILIAPQVVGDLKSAQGSYTSVRGKISSAWTHLDGEFRLKVSIPANCTATVVLPTSDAPSVREGTAVVAVRASNPGHVTVDLGAGDYEFTARLP